MPFTRRETVGLRAPEADEIPTDGALQTRLDAQRQQSCSSHAASPPCSLAGERDS
jgi:hypothetical protein